jgi:hypothetical protein
VPEILNLVVFCRRAAAGPGPALGQFRELLDCRLLCVANGKTVDSAGRMKQHEYDRSGPRTLCSLRTWTLTVIVPRPAACSLLARRVVPAWARSVVGAHIVISAVEIYQTTPLGVCAIFDGRYAGN